MSEGNAPSIDAYDELASGTETNEVPINLGSPVKNMMLKVQHPPSVLEGFVGLPTNDARSQVVCEWRGTDTTQQPIIPLGGESKQTAAVTDYPTDIAYLLTSSPFFPLIAFVLTTVDKNKIWVQDLANTIMNTNYNFSRFSEDATLYRPAYKSTTIALNSTAFNNTGIVSGYQFNPAILTRGVPDAVKRAGITLYELAMHDFRMFTSFIKQIHSPKIKEYTSYLQITKSKQSRYFNFPLHVRAALAAEYGLKPDDDLGVDPDTTIQLIDFSAVFKAPSEPGAPVPTASQILQGSVRSTSYLARDGVFAVQRLNNISPAFVPSGHPATSVSSGGLLASYYFCRNADGSYSYSPFSYFGASQANYATMLDVPWTSDMTWSWVRFSGLTFQAMATGPTTTTVNWGLIARKWYVGCEIQPAITSAWSANQKDGPKPDILAMQRLITEEYHKKDITEAKYNFLGGLGKIAANLAKNFVKSQGGPGGIVKKLMGATPEDDEHFTKIYKMMTETLDAQIEKRSGATSKSGKKKLNATKGIKKRLEAMDEEDVIKEIERLNLKREKLASKRKEKNKAKNVERASSKPKRKRNGKKKVTA